MQVKDVMTGDVSAVRAEATLEEAAALMALRDVGLLPVHDGERVVGVLTDRDIVTRAIACGVDPIQDRVCHAMTPGVVSCSEDQDVREAARLMEEHKVRRLVVLDRDEQLVGVVSLGDLAVSAGDETRVGDVLAAIVEPAEPAPTSRAGAAPIPPQTVGGSP